MASLLTLAKPIPTDNFWLVNKINAAILKAMENEIEIHFMWTPSHIGIAGNEKADQLAGIIPRIEDIREADTILNTDNVILQPNIQNPYDQIEIDLPPSISDFKAYTKSVMKNRWIHGLRWSSYGIQYNQFNPDMKPANIGHLKRTIQVRILRLRSGYYHRCAHRHINICSICETDFTLVHFLIECPKAALFVNELLEKLEPEQRIEDDHTRALCIMEIENDNGFKTLKKMVEKSPPLIKCVCVDVTHNTITED